MKTDATGIRTLTVSFTRTERHVVNLLSDTSLSRVITGLYVLRIAASLGVRFACTQVTPRILKLSNASSGRCPKCCDVRRAKWLAYPYMQRLSEHEDLRSEY